MQANELKIKILRTNNIIKILKAKAYTVDEMGLERRHPSWDLTIVCDI